MPHDSDMAKLNEAMNLISEHFDTLQIFATRHDPEAEGGTVVCNAGIGNWYARYGQVREWVVQREAGFLKPDGGSDDD